MPTSFCRVRTALSCAFTALLWAPTAGAPLKGASSGALTEQGRLRPDFSKVSLTYLGRNRLLSFNQWTGDHVLWQLDRDGIGKCDVVTWPPLTSGKWAPLRYHEFVFAGFTQLLALEPRSGKLTLTECDDSSFIARCQGAALQCSPLFTHQLSAGAHALHELTYLGSDLLLHYERNSGRYALLSFTRCPPMGANGSVDASAPRCAISDNPLASGTLVAGAIHTYLADGYLADGYLLAR